MGISTFSILSIYHPQMRHGNAFCRACLCVCLSCSCSNFWKPWHRNFTWYAGTTSEYLGHVHTSRSSGQDQGHTSKKWQFERK